MLSNILDRISFWSLFVVIVLLPVFFLPFTKIPLETSKGLLLVAGLIVSIICWAIARFSDGKIILPKSRLLLAGLGIVLAFLISAIFSPAFKVSFFGLMLDSGTFWFIFGAFLLMLVSSIVIRDTKNARIIFWGIIASSAVMMLFQSLRLFVPETLSLGFLGAKTGNLLGSWNELGIFAGLSAIVSLFVFEFLSISKIMKWLLFALAILSVFLIAVVNFSTIWIILGVFAFLIFIYKISFSLGAKRTEGKDRNFPALSFVIVLISLLFVISGQFIGGFLPNRLGALNLEVKPSFAVTLGVAKATLIKDPILGTGPNRFASAWNMYKPGAVNTTRFWDASFAGGSGLLPTFAITTGLLGIIAWLAFIVFLILAGGRALSVWHKKNELNVEVVMFFIVSLYLLVSSFFYSIGPALFLLLFAFFGIFIGLSASHKPKEEITVSFLEDARKSFFSILLLVLIMIASVVLGFKHVERFASIFYFQKALAAQSIPAAESSIADALTLYSNDLYLRTYAQIYLIKFNALAAKGSSLTDAEKADLQASFDQAINGAQLAIAYDPTNYWNFKMLGSVYETVAPLGVPDAYAKALDAYARASALNPLNPTLKLDLARVSFASGKIKEAKDYANEALALKPDYIDALIALSQIFKSEGNNTEALAYAEAALALDPQNKNLIQYVDSLKNSSSSDAALDSKDNKKETN